MQRRVTGHHSDHFSRAAANAAAATIDSTKFDVKVHHDRVGGIFSVLFIEKIAVSKNVHVVR